MRKTDQKLQNFWFVICSALTDIGCEVTTIPLQPTYQQTNLLT